MFQSNGGYPLYARPNNGRCFEKNGFIFDTVEWGKISPPFTFKCLYFRGVPLMKKIVLSIMNIGTNDSHITYSDVAIVSPVFFLICRVADL